jgi:RNA polymerase sigma-70 factor (ECF subfamily)
LDGLLELLAPEVTLCNDGNGLRGAPRIPVRGAEKVGRNLVFGIQKFLPPLAMGAALEATVVEVNGAPAGLISAGGRPHGVVVLDLDEACRRVSRIWIMANHDKLSGLVRLL